MCLEGNGPNIIYQIPVECEFSFGMLTPSRVANYIQPEDLGHGGEPSIYASEGQMALPSKDCLL
jgi:hypothetical protein